MTKKSLFVSSFLINLLILSGSSFAESYCVDCNAILKECNNNCDRNKAPNDQRKQDCKDGCNRSHYECSQSYPSCNIKSDKK